LVELAQLQDEEVGDGTTSVVIIAAELLRNADELVKQKIHPTSIIGGYRLACREAVKYIQVNNQPLNFFVSIESAVKTPTSN
jgi:T-complex protein 1 subunit alpha